MTSDSLSCSRKDFLFFNLEVTCTSEPTHPDGEVDNVSDVWRRGSGKEVKRKEDPCVDLM